MGVLVEFIHRVGNYGLGRLRCPLQTYSGFRE